MTDPGPKRFARLAGAARSLRVQVSVALLVAAAICAYVAAHSSGRELAGAYRDGGRELLSTAGESFRHDLMEEPGTRPVSLEERARSVRRLHPAIVGGVVWGRRGARNVALFVSGPEALADGRGIADPARRAPVTQPSQTEVRANGRHVAVLLLPLPANRFGATALQLSYDLEPLDAAMAKRTRRFALILTALLLGFTAFTALLLGRAVFTPLYRLRLATHRIRNGELASRLNWSRRDELGVLAHDFDEMAGGLEQSHHRLRALALQDTLTGLANHRHLHEVLAETTTRACAEKTPLSLVILGVDNFKRINDARGHTFGDDVLKAVGERLRGALKGIGFAARMGGDEFAVVLTDTDAPRAMALAEAARASVAGLDFPGFALTCSAGVACYPDDAKQATALVQLADGALDWAKRSGRDCARRYDSEHVLVITEEQRTVLDEMLERPDAIRPVFQPIMRMDTGEVAGYEALARFSGEGEGPPSWWFAQADRFGVGPQMEAKAVRVALAAEHRPAGTFLSVNVSPSALLAACLRDELPDDLRHIVIEITEHEHIGDEKALHAVLGPLRLRGARVAVDDAGAGYSGLQQVMRIGADIIKLDRAIVEGVHRDSAKRALVESFVSFAASTGAEVCAEGIECLEELRTLAQLGVVYGQGYALARPAPPWAPVADEARALCRDVLRERAPRVVSLSERRSAQPMDPA